MSGQKDYIVGKYLYDQYCAPKEALSDEDDWHMRKVMLGSMVAGGVAGFCYSLATNTVSPMAANIAMGTVMAGPAIGMATIVCEPLYDNIVKPLFSMALKYGGEKIKELHEAVKELHEKFFEISNTHNHEETNKIDIKNKIEMIRDASTPDGTSKTNQPTKP